MDAGKLAQNAGKFAQNADKFSQNAAKFLDKNKNSSKSNNDHVGCW